MDEKMILDELKEINNLPINEVKKKIDTMTMKFSEWESFTNETPSYYSSYREKKEIQNMLNDKTYITYEEFNKLKHMPISREFPKEASKVQDAKNRREELKEYLEYYILPKIRYIKNTNNSLFINLRQNNI
mgnify:CR=1 FL=1